MSLQTVEETHEDHHDHHHAENRQLLIDSRKFATECRWTSWWQLVVTLTLFVSLLCIVELYETTWMRLASSLVISLTIVRIFIIYHDFMHGAIFKGSNLAQLILTFCGHLMLTPPSVWKRSHDHHHQHNSKLTGDSIGSFPIMTTRGYLASTRRQKWEYRLSRSPMLILFGYFTVFLFGLCLWPLLQNIRKNPSSITSLLVHFGAIGLGYWFFGADFAIFALALPLFIAMMLGSYLFYVQHNYPTAQMHSKADWTYADAALDSSSFLESGAVLQWFLGNIGFHHIHHLNSKIPFYRLPEAMRGLPQLQEPGRISLSLKDIAACLQLKLWDDDKKQFVSFSFIKP